MSDDPELDEAVERITGEKDRPRYALVRFAVLRLLGLVYVFAFLGASRQLVGLVGARGLMPAARYLDALRDHFGSTGAAFLAQPTLFFFDGSDAALRLVSYLGLALALAVTAGVTNAAVMAILWALYLSIVQVGQTFYGYGWELLLCETGFVAIFLCPLRSWRPFPADETPRAVIWLLRWLSFRVMFGAGLIKVRGDPCWQALTCLDTHFETQPLPNPLSWLFHFAPGWVHATGVLVNHLVELVAPFFLFGPRRFRYAAGVSIIGFQLALIVSGNLSFLNWLTIVPTLAAFDDRALARLFPRRFRALPDPPPSRIRSVVAWTFFAVVLVLSVDPAMNLLSRHQSMNAAYDRLDLVNSYGAFGSVERVRHQVVLEGTNDDPSDPSARWQAYELPCNPGDPARMPCIHAPYQDRLDWQMWFASLSDYERQPWIVHLVDALLRGEPSVLALFSKDPFPDAPPRFVRASFYRYRMTGAGEPGWWRRERLGDYLRPLSKDDPALRAFLARHGWD